MKIGIIGSGGIGQAFAGQVAKAGYEVILSNSRGSDTLTEIVAEMGPNVSAGSVEAAAAADVIFLSVPWSALPTVAAAVAWNGKIVIDAINPILPGFEIAELHGLTSSEKVAELLSGARVVKAFNTLATAILAADPRSNGGNRVIFFSGDDLEAKKIIGDIIAATGFAGIDLGGLAEGGRVQQFPSGPLTTLNLIKL